MIQYRLKSEAVQFFKEKYATSIYPLDTWRSIGVDDKALEEIKPPYLKYGQKMTDSESKVIGATLGGWDKNGKEFEFTIHFNGVTMYECDKFSNGKLVRELMDKIQRDIDYWYSQFTNKEDKADH